MQTSRGQQAMQQTTEWATIGVIVAPFGLQGELKVFSLSDIPDRFTALDIVYVGPQHTRFSVKKVRSHKGSLVLLTLAGIDNANAAETLRNNDLFIPVDDLAELPTDSYYQHDILGLHVLTLEDRDLGIVEDIMQTGSNDVYVIKDSHGKQVLIPAIKQIVKRIDLSTKRIYIDPIRGLLNDDDAVHDDNVDE
jgi:16S rRNA processing protein RimM